MLNTRIMLKRAHADVWETKPSFVPYAGEAIVYQGETAQDAPMMKIGDGTTALSALPFLHGDDEPITSLAIENMWIEVFR